MIHNSVCAKGVVSEMMLRFNCKIRRPGCPSEGIGCLSKSFLTAQGKGYIYIIVSAVLGSKVSVFTSGSQVGLLEQIAVLSPIYRWPGPGSF